MNKRNKGTFEFDLTDAPMLLRALSIGASTALMCGHPGAHSRMKQYVEIMRQFAPSAALLFDPESWCELWMALGTAETYAISLAPHKWAAKYRQEKAIAVTVGGRIWFSKQDRFTDQSPELDAVRRLLRDLAPMDSEEVVNGQ